MHDFGPSFNYFSAGLWKCIVIPCAGLSNELLIETRCKTTDWHPQKGQHTSDSLPILSASCKIQITVQVHGLHITFYQYKPHVNNENVFCH